ncbi:GIY-YIG nuclease family protein [Haloferacaceae archaeon DSL9]
MASPGSYVLFVSLPAATTIEVGALGPIDFAAGTYAYVGSAFGPGGLSRVDRHRELAVGERDARHWHVDYLLGNSATTRTEAVTYPDRDIECDLAATLPGTVVDGFGASDCDCRGHLLWTTEGETIRAAARKRRP